MAHLKQKMIHKYSWFQIVLLIYFVILFFFNRLHSTLDIAGSLGYALGIIFWLFLLMFLYNKFLRPKINIKNKTLKIIWLVIKILCTVYIMFWIFVMARGVIRVMVLFS